MSYDELWKQTKSKLEEGGLDAGISYIDNYIDESPDCLEAYIIRSELYAEMGDFQEAFDDAEKAIKINPNDAAAYNNRGCIYVKSGSDINKALNDFNKAIELNARFVSAYTNRANVYLKLREPQKAIDDCTKAIGISPSENAEPYYNRGLAYANMGEIAKSLDDYNMVIKLTPENAEAYAKRGFLNSQLGNTQEAIRDYEEFLRLDANNANAELVRNALRELRSSNVPLTNSNSKKQKTMLIGAIIGATIGAIIGAADPSGTTVLVGAWFGIGFGGNIDLVADIPGIFSVGLEREGLLEAIKTTIGGILVWAIILTLFGPIGFLVRFFRNK